jgi:hypothetical protein
MSFLGKVFGIKEKKQTYSKDNKFKLCIVDETSDMMHEILGITDARGKELATLVCESFDTTEGIIEATQKILEGCNHINEVVLALHALNRRLEIAKLDHLKGSLGDILKRHGRG